MLLIFRKKCKGCKNRKNKDLCFKCHKWINWENTENNYSPEYFLISEIKKAIRKRFCRHFWIIPKRGQHCIYKCKKCGKEKLHGKKYILVRAFSDHDLENYVNGYIEQGYRPIGGIQIFNFSSSNFWQAMYRRK